MKHIYSFFCILCLIFLNNYSQAAVVNWIGTNGEWDDPLNWDSGSLPTPNDSTWIYAGASVIINPGVTATCKYLRVDLDSEVMNCGTILLGNNNIDGLVVVGTFTNNGLITASNYGFDALINLGLFINNGEINLLNANNNGMSNVGDASPIHEFINNGVINIVSPNSLNGISNRRNAIFTNCGLINITINGAFPGLTNFWLSSIFTNDGGTINFINSTSYIFNDVANTIINQNCGLFNAYQILNNGTFTNDAYINFSGTTAPSPFTNNGSIYDPNSVVTVGGDVNQGAAYEEYSKPIFSICPEIDLCADNLMIPLNVVLPNNSSLVATWSGPSSSFINDQGTPSLTDDVIDVSSFNISTTGSLTLTYDNGVCLTEQTREFSFYATSCELSCANCDANGGQF